MQITHRYDGWWWVWKKANQLKKTTHRCQKIHINLSSLQTKIGFYQTEGAHNVLTNCKVSQLTFDYQVETCDAQILLCHVCRTTFGKSLGLLTGWHTPPNQRLQSYRIGLHTKQKSLGRPRCSLPERPGIRPRSGRWSETGPNTNAQNSATSGPMEYMVFHPRRGRRSKTNLNSTMCFPKIG